MSDVRELWRQHHGFTQEQLHEYAKDLEWLLNDPRFQDPNYQPPESLKKVFGLMQMMEAEIIRLMTSGPPYEPKMDLDGAFVLSQIHEYFPHRWVEFLTRLGLPASAITPEMAKEWQSQFEAGIALRNGDLLSTLPWTVTDPTWSLLLPSYTAMVLDPSIKPPFGTDPAWIVVDDADEIALAIVGDWGSGEYIDGEAKRNPPEEIMDQIQALDADYTVHLGDVYPVGSSRFYAWFLERWRPGRRGTFTLNSNHDMYAWGKGLFEDALQHPMFAAQQGTSYFAVEFGDWIVLGLDSAYHDPTVLVFAGYVTDPDQLAFIQRVRQRADEAGKKVFVMTHHCALDPTGTKTLPLWDQLVADSALGRAPDVWYYGHYHASAVYSADSVVGGTTKVRVFGHGALPFAPPGELAENSGSGKPIECYAHTPYPGDDPAQRGRAMNGFAVVTLTKDGEMRERFLNQDGSDMRG